MKNLVGTVRFIEPISLFRPRQRFVAITEKEIEQLISKHKSDRELLVEYAELLTEESGFDTLVNNWAFAKLYHDAKNISVRTTQYLYKDAKKLLMDFNRTALPTPENGTDLLTFVQSLTEYEAKTFTFDESDESLQFLLSKKDYKGKFSIERINDPAFHAKKEFIAVLTNTFYALGPKYKPVLVTSTVRTVEEQVEIFMSKLEARQNMYEYYRTKISNEISPTLDYLQTIQARFDGTEVDQVRLKRISNTKHQEEIQKITKKDRNTVEKLLNEYMTAESFTPSLHMKGRAVDLSVRGEYEKTALKTTEFTKRKSYSITNSKDGEPHVHLNL